MNFKIQISIIFLLVFILLGGIIYVLTLEDDINRVNEDFNYNMSLEERTELANSIPKRKWIKVKGDEDNMYFKGKANANNIELQLTEPFKINSKYEVLKESTERVLLLETSLEGGGVKPIRYVYDFDIIEPGTYRLNISSEYDFKVILRRKREQ